VAQEDSARAETEIPLDADAVFKFVSDIEHLLRLNPHLEIETWQRIPEGMRFVAMNETTGRRIETAVRVEMTPATRSIVLTYAEGLKRATTLAVESGDGQVCRLVVTEHYPVIEDAQDPRVADVDRSLMPPRQRRIVRMIIWVSLAEFVVFLAVAAIFWLEQRGG
jgi:hypothetical protein